MSIGNVFKTFAAFLYVTDTEQQAVMRMYDWEPVYMQGDRQLYFKASFLRNGKEYTVVAARQPEMGMTAAAIVSMKLIWQWSPQYLIMPGIAAGIESEVEDERMFGDVLLPEAVWNCSNGKYVSPEYGDIVFGNLGFIQRPTIVYIDQKIMPYLEKAIHDPENQCHVHTGYLASGSAVMANEDAINTLTKSFGEKTRGLEMEGYGVVLAAQEAPEPRPIPIVAKSICDFGNSRKDDRFQRFAAYTSCEFVKFLCEKHLPDRNI